jgi:hypothetical protein
MTVQDTRTVTVPPQARPVDPPPAPLPPAAAAAPAPASAPLIGRDRPRTAEEREFALALTAMLVCLGTFITVLLLLAEYVWS